MITYYRSNHGALETIDKPEPGCWINVYEPTEKELGWLSQSLDISRRRGIGPCRCRP